MTETTDFNPTLLPCPFCGNEDVYYAEDSSECIIRCDECDFDLTEPWHLDDDTEGIELVARWNRRAPDSPKDALIVELLEELEELVTAECRAECNGSCEPAVTQCWLRKYKLLIAKAKGKTTSF